MSFKDYLKEAMVSVKSEEVDEYGDYKVDYKGKILNYDDIGEIIANNGRMLGKMGVEGVTIDDMESDSRKFLAFMLRHLEELKKKFNFNADTKSLKRDYENFSGNEHPMLPVKDFKRKFLSYNEIADLVIDDDNMLRLMGREDLTANDRKQNTIPFFNFIIKHLEELKKKYNFDSNYEFLRKDYGDQYIS